MKHDANTACQFESIFMCSGWSSSCTSNTTFSGNCPNCEIIVGKGQYSQYSCSSVFESRVSEEFKWLMLGGCSDWSYRTIELYGVLCREEVLMG